MPKMLLFDGNSIVTSNYYGSAYRQANMTDEEYLASIMQTSKGIYTNAILITLKQLIYFIIREKPDYLAFAFDKSRNTFRKEIYSDYKGTRSQSPSPLIEQLNALQKIFDKIGIPYYISDKYEADDLIASIVYQFKDINDMQIQIVTKDRDYYQLVDDNVMIWQPKESEEKANAWYEKWGYDSNEREKMPKKIVPVTKEVVFDEFLVEPKLIPDLKGIIGDTSDNIPGVKGVSSAASTLLSYYGSLENIYIALENNLDEFNAVCKTLLIKRNPAKALLNNCKEAIMSKRLATMVTPYYDNEIVKFIPTDINEIKYKLNTKIYDIADEYEMESLLSYIGALKNAKLLTEEEKILHLAIVSDTEDDLDNLYLIIRKLCSQRKCKIYCNSHIGSLNINKYDLNSFISIKEDKAYLLIQHKGIKSNINKMIDFAKAHKCQVRLAIISENENPKILSNI